MPNLQFFVDHLVPRLCTHDDPIEPPRIPTSGDRLTLKHIQLAEEWFERLVKCAQNTSIPKSRRCNTECGKNGYDLSYCVKEVYESERRKEAGYQDPEGVDLHVLAAARRGVAPTCQAMDRSANRGRYHPSESDDPLEVGTVMFNDGYEPYHPRHKLLPIYTKKTIWELSESQLEAYERGYGLVGEITTMDGQILDPIDERRQRLYMSLSGHFI